MLKHHTFIERQTPYSLFLLGVLWSCLTYAQVNIEVLGQPFASRYPDISTRYAKNIWDMKWFQGKLYLGAGNSSNKGPATNAGPVPIIYYDPISHSFQQEGEVDDEQIDRYVVLNDTLYIPGHDPKQSWKLGNYYQYRNEGYWEKIRRIPHGIHVYDMTSFDGSIFAALGTPDGGAISRSDDGGKHWTNIYNTNSRIYSFLKLYNRLYAISNTDIINGKGESLVIEYNEGHINILTDLPLQTLFPETSLHEGKNVKIVHCHSFDDKALYIGAYSHNDHQMQPFGLYLVSPQGIHILNLPDSFKPWDLLIRSNDIYLLTNQINNMESIAQVFHASIDQPDNMRSLFSIRLDNGFARSFEEKDGIFYLSIGSEVNNPRDFSLSEISSETGTLIEIKPINME